ncbi:hypothetical protein HELRODRAFT_178694 [Helobdella robusta]|uniref:Zinc finger PHD-type domain-containing protein n=1 Tax=Helobdella robusta TaxID=6412 RepID=T1FDK9_HELRO|nr:hypothetical protein HELRODRAFT_178694 [Helobdella robusta]ESN96894.1 hypothetical protein HELRODRAFT_178694 [Helobdella robusta]
MKKYKLREAETARQRERDKTEFRLKSQELDSTTRSRVYNRRVADDAGEDNDTVKVMQQTPFFAESLKHLIGTCPLESRDIPAFFEHVLFILLHNKNYSTPILLFVRYLFIFGQNDYFSSTDVREKKRKFSRGDWGRMDQDICVMCGEAGRDNEMWFRCRNCAKWAHELCTSVSSAVDYICEFCIHE